jgi:hypothetical protein
MLVGAAAADSIKWVLLTQDGVPLVVNGEDIVGLGGPISSYRPQTLTINPRSGMLYLAQIRRNALTTSGVRMYDSSHRTKTTAPDNVAWTGTMDAGGGEPQDEFSGAVQGANRDWNVDYDRSITFNPNYTKGGAYTGCVVHTAGGGTGRTPLEDFVPQTASESWGEIHEGAMDSPNNDAARFATNSVNVGGSGSPDKSGLAYIDRRIGEDGSQVVDRFLLWIQPSSGSNYGLYMYEISTNVTGASNTNAGTRPFADRVGSATTLLVSTAEFTNLVPNVDDKVCDIAVRPDENPADDSFDIYILSFDSVKTNTYLNAFRATLPANPAGWSKVQLDVSGNTDDGINYLQLRDTAYDLDIYGTGIVFSQNGKELFVASQAAIPSTGNPLYDDGRIYIFTGRSSKPKGTSIFVR